MKTTLRGYAVACLTALMILGSACTNEDNTPSDKKETVDNPELLMALKTKGFKVEGSTVTLTPKELKMTELDLSGAGLKSLKGLEIFPMLTSVNLENNNFGDSIDFAQLPEKITSVDLAKNKIYKWKGLIKVNFNSTDANSAFKVLRQLKSLTLPYTARYDMEALPYYFTNKGAEKMMMENKEGQVEPYTTLREIPDPVLREKLQESVPSIMTKDGKIDISKRIKTEEATVGFNISDDNKSFLIHNIEGLEFLINSPFYRQRTIEIMCYDHSIEYTLEYLKPNKYVNTLRAFNVTTLYTDFSKATELKEIWIAKNKSLEQIDISNNTAFLQADGGLGNDARQSLILYDCPKLKEVKLPKVKEEKPLAYLILIDLPELNNINTDKINAVGRLYIALLPKIKSLSLTQLTGVGYPSDQPAIYTNPNPKHKIEFATTKESLHIQGLKDFISRMHKEKKIDDYPSFFSSAISYYSDDFEISNQKNKIKVEDYYLWSE